MRIGPQESRRLLADNPAHALALQNVAIDLLSGGDGLGAICQYRRAYSLHRDKAVFDQQIAAVLDAALNQVTLLLDPGQFDEAGDILMDLLPLAPNNSRLARLLGTVRVIQGRDRDALAMLDRMEPRASGLAVAMDSIKKSREQNDFIGTIVIPCHCAAITIGRSLDSVLTCIAHYRSTRNRPEAKVHIVIVDDASTDDAVDIIRRWSRAHPAQSLTLIANSQNAGAGAARNAGAAAAKGPYLWFLDSDDYFLDPHLTVTSEVLDQRPDLDYVRTDMVFDQIDDLVTPVWRTASRNTYPCNLCIRRISHNRVGGFPEEEPFLPATADDVCYSRALSQDLSGVGLREKTVFYSLSPGNVLDRLRTDMISGKVPGEGNVVDDRFMAIEILIRRRLYELSHRNSEARAEWTKAQADTLLAQARIADDAGAPWLLKQALALAPDRHDIWFELGGALHRLQRTDEAQNAYCNAIRLNATLAPAHSNLGLLQLEAGDTAGAASCFEQSLRLRPDSNNTRFLLGSARRKQGRLKEAADLLQQVVALEPTKAAFQAELAATLLDQGDIGGALRTARLAAMLAPTLYEAHAVLAASLEASGDGRGALDTWTQAIQCNPGYGEAFSRRALLLLSQSGGVHPVPRPGINAPDRRLTIRALGRNGRFGNQLLQYGTTALYAARNGLELQVPLWPGRVLFDHDDPLPSIPALPRLANAEQILPAGLVEGNSPLAAGHDIDAYFCGDTTVLAPYADEFRRLFTPGRYLRAQAARVSDRLRSRGRTIVAIHIRHGDYGWGRFWTAPIEWYQDWLTALWPTLDQPVLFVASDDSAVVQNFSAFNPLTAANIDSALPGAEFFVDFHALCIADHAAISNSSFSFTARMLHSGSGSHFRPHPPTQSLVQYNPWGSPVLL